MQNLTSLRNNWFINQVEALKISGVTMVLIAHRLDIKPQYLNAILHGTRNVSDKFFAKFCDAFGINQNDIYFDFEKGRTLDIDTIDIAKVSPVIDSTLDESTRIPLVEASAVAGFGNSDFAIQKSDVKDYYVVPKFKDRRIDFMIEVSGSSMYPKYNSGDVVACTVLRESRFIQWNKVHIIGTKEQGILIKRVKKGPQSNELLLISENKDYDPFVIDMDEITGMAIVVGVIRLE